MTQQKGRAQPGATGRAHHTDLKAVGWHEMYNHLITDSGSVKQILQRVIVFLALRGLFPISWADRLSGLGGQSYE